MIAPVISMKSIFNLSFFSGSAGFGKSFVDSKIFVFIKPYFGAPFIQPRNPTNTHVTGRIVFGDTEISAVFAAGNGSKIYPSVVVSIAVDMVNFLRNIITHKHKRKTRSVIPFSINPNTPITRVGLNVSRDSVFSATPTTNLPCEDSSLRIVVNDASYFVFWYAWISHMILLTNRVVRRWSVDSRPLLHYNTTEGVAL